MPDKSRDRKVVIGFELTPTTLEQEAFFPSLFQHDVAAGEEETFVSIECQYSFSASGPKEQRELLRLQPRLENSFICVNVETGHGHNREEIAIQRNHRDVKEKLAQHHIAEGNLQRVQLGSLEYQIKKPTRYISNIRSSRYPTEGKPIGASLKHFLPEQVAVVYDAVADQTKRFVEVLVDAPYRRRGSESTLNRILEDSPDIRKIVLSTFRQAAEDLRGPTQARFLALVSDLEKDFTIENVRRCYVLPSAQRLSISSKLAQQSSELECAIRGGRDAEPTVAYVPLSDQMEESVDYIQKFFTRRVRYLGPLRDEPKPIYPLAGTNDPLDIGFRGEHTASVLDLQKQTLVTYIPSFQFEQENTPYASRAVPLQEAVLDWLRYMGVATNVETVDRGKLGHELRVSTETNSLHDLTHVGVGVSQVLPILVLALLAEEGSTLVFEQPELHLHPRVQSRLADFFVSMMMLNLQCIVETHSEYMINRLRYRVAISRGKDLSDKVIMYFVEKDAGTSTYREIRINEFGVIESWPRGFFDEDEEVASAILRAGMSKRRQTVTKRNA